MTDLREPQSIQPTFEQDDPNDIELPVETAAPEHESEDEDETLYNPDALTRISSIAQWVSWLFLGLALIVVVILGAVLWLFATGQITIWQLIGEYLSAAVPLMVGGFFWVVLRLAAEGIYLLMDIEVNTRNAIKPQAKAKTM